MESDWRRQYFEMGLSWDYPTDFPADFRPGLAAPYFVFRPVMLTNNYGRAVSFAATFYYDVGTQLWQPWVTVGKPAGVNFPYGLTVPPDH